MSPLQPALIAFSSLEEFGTRLQALLEERKPFGFPGKAKRSQEVVNLFWQFRTAIVCYHVSEV